jgi:hypothetical protein
MPPEIGHLVYSFYNELGIVVSVLHDEEEDLYLIEVEWFSDEGGYKEIYRVVENDETRIFDDFSYIRSFDYDTMRLRYIEFRNRTLNIKK